MKLALFAPVAMALFLPYAVAGAPVPGDAKHPESYYIKKICRSEPTIGSRLTTTTRCMSQAEWDQIRMEQRRTVDRIQAFKPETGG
ncbi:MAG: hypothetical protein QOK17_2846 [Sphingomonadales bacterium]|jgi:hypothetical protein|nr:hypothetical protein [Sphingomonadales bacterium]